ncbi:MAG: hypothetical protein Q7R77_02730 [Candidatus Daviesbacteria bacterium]|nr:hypothetical protein [Candidatus Daviesbacteria bacterium]
MKPLLLHGPAKAASRIKLLELKQKFSAKGGPSFGWNPNNIVVLEEGTDLKIIKETLSAQSLFSDEQLIILENPPEDFFDYELRTVNYELILWFDHKVDPKDWHGFEELFFPESKEVSVFPFLDLLAAKDTKAYLEFYKLKNAGFDIYYLLTMIFYLLRSLAVTPKKAPDFVKKKLDRQRANFSKEKITDLYKNMLEIDFKIKSGFLEKDHAEFLLVNKFIGSLGF